MCEFIQNSSTKINLLQGIYNWINFGNAAHYRITIKNMNSMYAAFWILGEHSSVLDKIVRVSQNLWIFNMTLTFFCTSISVLNFCLEQNYNKTQSLIKFLVCQLLRAHQMKYLEKFCVMKKNLVIFEDSNNQHALIFKWINRQQQTRFWKWETSCSCITQ